MLNLAMNVEIIYNTTALLLHEDCVGDIMKKYYLVCSSVV